METIPDPDEWMSPWQPISANDDLLIVSLGNLCPELPSDCAIAKVLEDELKDELPSAHALAGVSVRAVAYCAADHNEFMFLTDLPSHPIACVHLTWQKEADQTFPYTVLFSSLDDWTSQMLREHEGAAKLRAAQGGGDQTPTTVE